MINISSRGFAFRGDTRTDRVDVPELFERGAFADLVASGARVKLIDYNHDEKRIPVGYSTNIEDRDAGLWARFHINDTPEGDSAIRNTRAQVYEGLSIGFLTRGERNVNGFVTSHPRAYITSRWSRSPPIKRHRSSRCDPRRRHRTRNCDGSSNPRRKSDTREHKSQNLLMARFVVGRIGP